MAKLMIHRNILKEYRKLPSKVQKRIPELIFEFQADPHSDAIGMHPVTETMLDPKVRGITKLPDGYRAIIIAPEQGDTYLLVHIDSHDRAYQWAKNKRFEVHGATGVFQVFDTDELEAAASDASQSGSPATDGALYPLQKLTAEELYAAGVPQPLISAVQNITDDAQLEALIEYLPPDCRDMLYGLASGMSLDEAFEEMLGRTKDEKINVPDSAGDFSKIEMAPNFDLVVADDEESLRQILSASIEEWRIFLHPYQRKIVHRKTNGPMSITGSAGTGKTVALIHRAVHLASQLKDPSHRVLVTTFTTNLSVTLQEHIERLNPKAAKRIDVTNLHALARTICSRAGWKGRIIESSELDSLWEQVLQQFSDLPLSNSEMRLEFDLVIDANGIDSEDDYLTTVRSGRPTSPRLTRADRRAAWAVFREFRRALKKQDLLTFEGAIHQARLAATSGKFNAYEHVLVDEAQDFSLEGLRLIHAISPAADEHPDPLCLAGDAHQRIYRAKIPMSRAGINIRGRSSRFKINYRTTEQIRLFAHTILHGESFDNLDGEVISTDGDHSVISGAAPRVVHCHDEQEQSNAVFEWIEQLLEAGFATHEICVTPPNSLLQTSLATKGIPTRPLVAREVDPGSKEPGIRFGTMARIKGLEYRAIAMLCSNPTDPMNHIEQADIRDRCQRYVAATRAREQLLICIAAQPSFDK